MLGIFLRVWQILLIVIVAGCAALLLVRHDWLTGIVFAVFAILMVPLTIYLQRRQALAHTRSLSQIEHDEGP
jgi:hypothetical protein